MEKEMDEGERERDIDHIRNRKRETTGQKVIPIEQPPLIVTSTLAYCNQLSLILHLSFFDMR